MRAHLTDFLKDGAFVHRPEAVGLVDGDRQWTFRQWHAQARSLADRLLDRVPAGTHPIAVFLPKCAETLIADIGILLAGHFYLNLDLSAPGVRQQAILATVAPPLVMTRREHAPLLLALGVGEDRLLFLDDPVPPPSARVDERIAQRLAERIDTDPACVITTSGSTGEPKATVLSHRGLIDFLEWWDERFGWGEGEIVGSLSPFHFDGYIIGFWMSLWKGAKLLVVPSGLALFPLRLAEFLRDEAVTFLFWVPTIMVNMANLDVFRDCPLPSLRTVCFAGEVFPTRHLNAWRRHMPGATYINLYGPIEISVICTYFVVDREFGDDEPLPIGWPCRNTGILLLDEEDREARGEEPGELCVRGSCLAHGYWGHAEATAKAFAVNPLRREWPERIYRTGDIARYNARGELLFLGRRDHQVKHQGVRFDLGEIEHFALKVPEITNVCATYDKERKRLTLFYESPSEIPAKDLRQALLAQLPKVQVPTHFLHRTELPRNSNGKIDRQSLSLESQRLP